MASSATPTVGTASSAIAALGGPLDQAAARQAVARVAARLVDLLGALPSTDVPIPGLDWTVAGTAAHLVMAFRAFAAAVEGRFDGLGSPEAEALLATLADVPDQQDSQALARQVSDAVRVFLDASADRSPDHQFPTPWYAIDRTNRLGPMTCLLLGELVVHGGDIAAGAGRPWPIEGEDARQIIARVFPAKIPVLVDPETTKGVQARIAIDADSGPSLVVEISDGRAAVHPHDSRPVDCHVAGDPAAILLFAYGRVTPESLFNQARLKAWGKNPSLGLRFKSYFKNP